MGNSDMQSVRSSVLASYAMDPSKSKGRLYALEKANPFIDNFQEDVFRIIRSTSFRRLAHKTQVFVNDSNKIDHYRSRLTHTLEASVISRIISQTLQLSSPLTEAVCLAHDIGHPPFGHSGEDVLNEILKPHGGFNHNYYAFKLITKLEEKHLGYDGLNLTWETLEGIIKHNGPLIGSLAPKPAVLPDFIEQYNKAYDLQLDKFSSLEAQAASVSDDIAYVSHDLEDGLNERLFSLESILQQPFASAIGLNFQLSANNLDEKRITHEAMFIITNFFIEDVISNSKTKIKESQIITPQDAMNYNEPIVSFSKPGQSILDQIKDFLRKNMYRSSKILETRDEYKHLIQQVYDLLLNNPNLLPAQWRKKEGTLPLLIGDYIAGMTDNFIIKLHRQFYKQ
jgi:dGTPase